jgi:hypothetical protein
MTRAVITGMPITAIHKEESRRDKYRHKTLSVLTSSFMEKDTNIIFDPFLGETYRV